MEIAIDIIGEGKVEKVADSNSATLTAIPNENWTFKHFLIGNTATSENPISVTVTEVTAVFYISIEDYLKGLVGFDVTESVLNSIRIYREIKKRTDVAELSTKQRDLLYADLLMWASTSPTSYTGTKEADGGWSKTEANKTISVTDKKRFENLAMSIYKKYLDRKYNPSIKIVNLW
ncbi:hypothetical protein CLV62_104127 [Dysgonomonas alginatilytica]|uniref:Uncharacterized protein n=1 Tax=Dysgonomonas alginatilytica TaxID=1605892 RepID=A0A2V3PRP2_9BACT|nr:hypothetical protein [Dysgonomonas alginatilytica]PXV66866.1 hypothetical protein CLV62_104127 [Dysgonomonas alginatilytica]